MDANNPCQNYGPVTKPPIYPGKLLYGWNSPFLSQTPLTYVKEWAEVCVSCDAQLYTPLFWRFCLFNADLFLRHHFGHILWREDSLEKTKTLGEVESSRKRRRHCGEIDWPSSRSHGLYFARHRAVHNRRFWRSLIHRVTITWGATWGHIIITYCFPHIIFFLSKPASELLFALKEEET